MTPVLLTVGTTHPLNIAGVGLDARIAALVGVRLVTVVAGVSAQDAKAVLARLPLDDALIAAQFAAVRSAPIAAVHVGALLDAASVNAVAREVGALTGVPVVCDPVLAATGGDRLADDSVTHALRERLFPHCTLVTPNLDEAATLLGRPVGTVAEMERAAQDLRAGGFGAVLIKGGHLGADPTDVLATPDGVTRLSATRITGTLRGTGDLLACAIAARLAYGDSLGASVEAGRAFVRGALAAAIPFAGTYTLP